MRETIDLTEFNKIHNAPGADAYAIYDEAGNLVGTTREIHGRFTSMQDAFDYVREKGQPEIVEIDGNGTIGIEKWKLYPSGAAKQL